MINFTNPGENVQARRKLSKKVTAWVEDALPEDYQDVIVMVNEMQCYEPVTALLSLLLPHAALLPGSSSCMSRRVVHLSRQ